MPIPQMILNVAADLPCNIPKGFPALEVVAAASVIANQIAAPEPPDRSHFAVAIPEYLKSLPSDEAEALLVIARDAAAALGIDGLAADRLKVDKANRVLAEAQAKADEASSNQGRRLSRIQALESQLPALRDRVDQWQGIDFEGIAAAADADIITHFFTGIEVNGPFQDHQRITILRRLSPAAIKNITAKIAVIETELSALRGI